MSGVNKVILVGRLGRDPEVRTFQDGTSVCNFSIATSEEWKDKNTDEKKEKTEWHRIVVFRKLAEICGRYLSKGRMCFVEGKMQTRQYDKDGQTHYATEIVADKVQFLGGGQNQQGGTQQNQNNGQQARSGAGAYGGGQRGYDPGPQDNLPDDDIPF